MVTWASRRLTRSGHFVHYRRQLVFVVWVLVGTLSYGALWIAMIHKDDGQSFTALSTSYRERDELRQRAARENVVAEQLRKQADEERREQNLKNKNIRQREAKDQNHLGQDRAMFLDWNFWALVLCFALMSYARIRSEPPRRRHPSRSSAHGIVRQDGNAAAWHTLRRINREREARGETPISLEAYQTLRMLLMQDRMLLQELAGHNVPPPQRGVTQEQLATCQEYTIKEGEDYEGECCICLASFEANDQIRILPCIHSYHKGCIDHWFEQSTLCPICKHALHDGGA